MMNHQIYDLIKTFYHLTNSPTYFVCLGKEEKIIKYPPENMDYPRECQKKIFRGLIKAFKNQHDTTIEIPFREEEILLAYSFVDSNAFVISGSFTFKEGIVNSDSFCTREQLDAYKVAMSYLFRNVIGVASTSKEIFETDKEREMVFEQQKYYIHSYKLEKVFFDHFLSGEEKSIKLLREMDIFQRPSAGYEDTLRIVKNRLITAVAIVSRKVIEAGVDSEDSFLYSDYFINKIEEIEKLSEANEVLYNIYEIYLNLLKKSRQFKYSPIVERAIKYMKENTTKEISLLDIAQTLNVHPNYLSTIFNRETGSSLTYFITSLRMDEAKKLLAYTDQPILEIALSLGFNSQSYFTTVFKKYTSMNPKEFRTKNRSI